MHVFEVPEGSATAREYSRYHTYIERHCNYKCLCNHQSYDVWLIYVYVYVCAAMCNVTELCENSMFSLWLFPAYVCVCLLLCFLFQLGQASFEVLVNCTYFQIN